MNYTKVYSAGDRTRRAQMAALKREEARSKQDDPARKHKEKVLRAVNNVGNARIALESAMSHRDTIAVKLAELKASAARLDEVSFRKGVIHDGSASVDFQLRKMVPMLDRAEQEILAAQARLDSALAAQALAAQASLVEQEHAEEVVSEPEIPSLTAATPKAKRARA